MEMHSFRIRVKMTVTKVGVIYSKAQNRRRSIIKSDIADEHIDIHKNHLLQGERWLEIPLKLYEDFTNPAQIDVYIENVLGAQASSHKCAIINANDIIVGCVCGDPIIDDVPDGVLIQDDDLEVGMTYDFENGKAIQ